MIDGGLCHTVMSVSCSLVVTCWKRSGLLSPLYVMFSCVFVTFPYGAIVTGLVLDCIDSDLCLLPNFINMQSLSKIHEWTQM